jgi:hypothetical protein
MKTYHVYSQFKDETHFLGKHRTETPAEAIDKAKAKNASVRFFNVFGGLDAMKVFALTEPHAQHHAIPEPRKWKERIA